MKPIHPLLASLVIASALTALIPAQGWAHTPQPSTATASQHGEDGDEPVYIVISRSSHFGVRDLTSIVNSARDSIDNDLVIARIPANRLNEVSEFVHEYEQRCGGYFAFASQQEAEDFVANDQSFKAITGVSGAPYTIDNPATVNAWLPLVNEANIYATISHLSSYRNRYYTSSYGQNSAQWIRDTWLNLAAGRSDISAELDTCSNCSTQPSVILTIAGNELADQVVVIGAHLDSISNSGGGVEMLAPGADDDASGIATITEIIRIAVASGWKPQRTVKFMGYAAEEVGLRGSNAIAQQFKANGVNVVGALQLDMTNYRNGASSDIRIVSDSANALLKTYFAEIFDAYLAPLGLTRGTYTCGYGCSDHASWTTAGYPAAMLIEPGNANGSFFSSLHTINDTLANMGDSAINSTKYARFGLAFLGEIAKTHPANSDRIFSDGFE